MGAESVRPRTIDVETAGRMLGIGRTTAYALARKGQLPGVIRLGRRLVVSVSALEALLAGHPPATG